MFVPNMFVIQPVKIPKFGEIGWTKTDLERAGEVAHNSIATRVAAGINRHGQPMKPLAEGYKKAKLRKGKSGIRDMNFSGNMMGSLGVLESDETHVDVGFRGATPRLKARFRQAFDAFMGLSATDAAAVDLSLRRDLAKNVRNAKVRASR